LIVKTNACSAAVGVEGWMLPQRVKGGFDFNDFSQLSLNVVRILPDY